MMGIRKYKCSTATPTEIETPTHLLTSPSSLTRTASVEAQKHSANNSDSYVTPEMAKDMAVSSAGLQPRLLH